MRPNLFTSSLHCHLQVEEKPDVTYSDVGGCKEQIEKLREVVEVPLLHVRQFIDLHDDKLVSVQGSY